jgi:hypothetical protein
MHCWSDQCCHNDYLHLNTGALTRLASSFAMSAVVLITVFPFSWSLRTTSTASLVSWAVSKMTWMSLNISSLRNFPEASCTLLITSSSVLAWKIPAVNRFKKEVRVLPLPSTRNELTCNGVSEWRKFYKANGQVSQRAVPLSYVVYY